MADSVTVNPLIVARDGTVTPQIVNLAPGQTVVLSPGQLVQLSPGQVTVQSILSSGTGPDGPVTLDGAVTVPWASKSGSVYTLTRDVFCTTLTINAGVTLIAAAYRVFAGALTVAGVLHNNGNNASGVTAGAGAPSGFYGGGANGGGSGNTGGAVTNGLGAAGGHGGGGAGAGGTATPPAATDGGIPRDRTTIVRPTLTYQGGAGGGGGVNSGGFGGAGGGGGGILAVFADSITVTAAGAIHARGGAGGNGQPGGGGGGGGGGGCPFLYYTTSFTNNGTVDANGGTPGAGNGSPDGSAGSPGNVIVTSFAIP